MKSLRLTQKKIAAATSVVALGLLAPSLQAQAAFEQINLVSDVPGLAHNTDPRLVNPWGISFGAASPFWVSDAGTGLSTLYNSSGTPQALVVTLPGPGGAVPAVPTGQLSNTTGAFNGDIFIFASATGTIEGWRPALGTTAEILANNFLSGASYLGVALGNVAGNNYLYAANFGNSRIDVLPNAGAPTLSGSFVDPNLPVGFAPFNVQNIGNSLFVTYAEHGAGGKEAVGAGLGVVDRFDLSGNLIGRFASGGALDAPWGLARAPAGFGSFGGNLLIGNFGDGTINAFDFNTGAMTGTLTNAQGIPLVNSGLWGLTFGNGGNGGSASTLYFAAGIQNETHGLFGAITPVPEPATTGLIAGATLLGLCAISGLRRRRKIRL